MCALFEVSCKDRRYRCTCDNFAVARSVQFRTCNCDGAGHINLAIEEQTTDDCNVNVVYGPNLLTLVDWVDVVDLNAYVSGRVLALECVEFYARDLWCVLLCIVAKVNLTLGQTSKNVEALLQGCLLTGSCQLIVRSQRSRVECRHKDRLRHIGRICDNAVRTLYEQCPKTRFQQKVDNLLTGCLLNIECLELLVCYLLISGNGYREDATLLTTVYSGNGTTNRRCEDNRRIVLRKEQCTTCLNRVTNLNEHFWSDTLEIEWRNCILGSQRKFRYLAFCSTFEVDVQTFEQFNDF